MNKNKQKRNKLLIHKPNFDGRKEQERSPPPPSKKMIKLSDNEEHQHNDDITYFHINLLITAIMSVEQLWPDKDNAWITYSWQTVYIAEDQDYSVILKVQVLSYSRICCIYNFGIYYNPFILSANDLLLFNFFLTITT